MTTLTSTEVRYKVNQEIIALNERIEKIGNGKEKCCTTGMYYNQYKSTTCSRCNGTTILNDEQKRKRIRSVQDSKIRLIDELKEWN